MRNRNDWDIREQHNTEPGFFFIFLSCICFGASRAALHKGLMLLLLLLVVLFCEIDTTHKDSTKDEMTCVHWSTSMQNGALCELHKWHLERDWLDQKRGKCLQVVGFHLKTQAIHSHMRSMYVFIVQAVVASSQPPPFPPH
jgi:hypothetical protein